MGKRNWKCGACESRYFETESELIAHYQKRHPDRPESLYDILGETWDETITLLVKKNLDLHKQLSELYRARRELLDLQAAVSGRTDYRRTDRVGFHACYAQSAPPQPPGSE